MSQMTLIESNISMISLYVSVNMNTVSFLGSLITILSIDLLTSRIKYYNKIYYDGREYNAIRTHPLFLFEM